MNLKTLFMTAFAAFTIHSAQAQDTFNEVSYSPGQTVFRLHAPSSARKVVVRIYPDALSAKPERTVRMKRTGNDTWQTVVKADLKGRFYTFDISGDKKSWCETPGVFAKAVGVNGKRGAIVDMATTNPQGWEGDVRPALQSPADLVVYELHHRDFSIDASSGLVHKGKFLALTEPKAIAHLKELGINAVHILPSYDFGSVDETKLSQPQYNWGYDPVNYNVPEGSYSTDPYNPLTRIREFKLMVQALHKAGIRVILDVVYNHTYDIEHSNFQRTYPDYFYRKKADGTYSDGSGCGNETASEKPLMREFMLESVKYWVSEYHIDGFRFDLMGVHDMETMNLIRAELSRIDPSIFVYGEGWSAGTCAYPADKLSVKAHMQQLPGIAAFSDELRDALRGPFSDDTKGAFLAGIPGEEESVKAGIAGMIAHPDVDYSKVNYTKTPWALEPVQMMSYVSCHDDMCLTDRLRASIPGIKDDELIRLDLLAQTAVFTSQGVPFMLSGEEMLRNKKGVHNSFESPDSINHLDWNNLQRYPQVFSYYKNLIGLRKSHPAFRLGDANKVREVLDFLPSQPCLVAFTLNGKLAGDSWQNIIVVLNGNPEPREIEVPAGSYTVVCCDGVINENGLGRMEGGKVVVDPQSALIIHN